MPSALDGRATSLEDLLGRELQLLNGLLELLARERACLIERDAPRILQITEEKRLALEALSAASSFSRRLLLAPKGARTQEVASHPASPDLIDAVRRTWIRVRDANQCNGAVMKLHQGSVLRGLGVLRQSIGGPDLYRADGRTSGHYLSA